MKQMDKMALEAMGYSLKDISVVESKSDKVRYILFDNNRLYGEKRIGIKQTRKLLGDEQYISGVAESILNGISIKDVTVPFGEFKIFFDYNNIHYGHVRFQFKLEDKIIEDLISYINLRDEVYFEEEELKALYEKEDFNPALEEDTEIIKDIDQMNTEMNCIEKRYARFDKNSGGIKYGVALLEKPLGGLNKDEINFLHDMVTSVFHNGSDEALPLDIMAKEHACSAMGFINLETANDLDYDYEGLEDFIASILDDMEKESPDHHYTYRGIDIYLSR